jgi:hypothetical protein
MTDMPASELRRLWENSKELNGIQKELEQHRKPFAARIKKLKQENTLLQKKVLEYLDKIQAPGIKMATGQARMDGKEEYFVVTKRDISSRSKKGQADSMKTVFQSHQIDPSSPLYQAALGVLEKPEKKVGIRVQTVDE